MKLVFNPFYNKYKLQIKNPIAENMAVPGLCQLLDPRKGRSLMQINTALQRMGFATWNDLEPGINENSSLFCKCVNQN